MNTFLIIENSRPDRSVVALGADGRVVARAVKKRRFHESEELLQRVDDLFKEGKTRARDLAGIIVVVGPGSFTALRAACVIANTMAYVEKLPLYGFKRSEYDELADLLKKTRTKKQKSYLEPFYGKAPKISR